MAQKVLSIKVDPADWDWFKDLAKGFNSQGEAFNALRQAYRGKSVNQSESSLDKEVYQNVCYPLGTKLPDDWELKNPLKEKKDRTWYVFPDDQVVALRKKSPNGNKDWLEVAAIYPSNIWEAAKSSSTFEYNPINALIKAYTAYKDEQVKRTHPAVIEALSKGWDLKRHWLIWDLTDIVNAANDYLLMANQLEVLPDKQVYQSVCDSQESNEPVKPTTDTPIKQATEIVSLTKGEMMTRYGLNEGVYGGLVGQAKREGKVQMNDGTYLSVRGKGVKAVWTQVSAIATVNV